MKPPASAEAPARRNIKRQPASRQNTKPPKRHAASKTPNLRRQSRQPQAAEAARSLNQAAEPQTAERQTKLQEIWLKICWLKHVRFNASARPLANRQWPSLLAAAPKAAQLA
jgi:hypothetical protein